jgi:hypothetical protein
MLFAIGHHEPIVKDRGEAGGGELRRDATEAILDAITAELVGKQERLYVGVS